MISFKKIFCKLDINGGTINAFGSLVYFLAQWLISVLIVRLDGYSDAGIFSLAMSLAGVFSYFANYNLRAYQITDVKKEFLQEHYWGARILSIIGSFIIGFLYLFFSGIYTKEVIVSVLLYLLFDNILVANDSIMASLQMYGRLDINGYSNILRGCNLFVFFLISYLMMHNLPVSIFMMCLSSLIIFVFFDIQKLKLYFDIERIHFKKIWNKALLILRNTLFLMLSGIVPMVINVIPRNMIYVLLGEEKLGFFSTIYTPTALLITIIPAFLLAYVPQIAVNWEEKKKKGLLAIHCRCYGICVGLVLLAFVAAFVIGRFVMELIFGEEILLYFNLLYWALLTTGLSALATYGTQALMAMRKTNLVFWCNFVALIVPVLSTRTLILKYDIYGGAIVLCGAYFVQVVIQTFIMLYYIKNMD